LTAFEQHYAQLKNVFVSTTGAVRGDPKGFPIENVGLPSGVEGVQPSFFFLELSKIEWTIFVLYSAICQKGWAPKKKLIENRKTIGLIIYTKRKQARMQRKQKRKEELGHHYIVENG
jgi:hypothetical protein